MMASFLGPKGKRKNFEKNKRHMWGVFHISFIGFSNALRRCSFGEMKKAFEPSR
jgi:hypothetical protein